MDNRKKRYQEIQNILALKEYKGVSLDKWLSMDIQLTMKSGLNWRLIIKEFFILLINYKDGAIICKKDHISAKGGMNLLICTASYDRFSGFFIPFFNSNTINWNIFSKSNIEIQDGINVSISPEIKYSAFLDALKVFRTSLTLKEKFLCFVKLSNRIKWFNFWEKYFIENKTDVVIADLDRYPSNVSSILAARALGVRNISLVHGSISPIDNYIPVVAEELWAWGAFHSKMFSSLIGNETKLLEVGNPKISFSPNSDLNSIIGLALTVETDYKLRKIIDIFLAGTKGINSIIKIHPNDNLDRYKDFKNSNTQIISNEYSSSEYLSKLKVICARRTQMGSDALLHNIPVIVIDGMDGVDLQNGSFLAEYARCPIVNNGKELESELVKLFTDKEYYRYRISQQNKCINLLYKFTGSASGEAMRRELERKYD